MAKQLTDVEDTHRLASPTQVALELLRNKGLATSREADQSKHNHVGIRGELSSLRYEAIDAWRRLADALPIGVAAAAG